MRDNIIDFPRREEEIKKFKINPWLLGVILSLLLYAAIAYVASIAWALI